MLFSCNIVAKEEFDMRPRLKFCHAGVFAAAQELCCAYTAHAKILRLSAGQQPGQHEPE
jgi:hypothetical protein